MTDNVANMTFDDDVVYDMSGKSLAITGTAQIDYTTDSFSMAYDASGSGGNYSGSISSPGGLFDEGGIYSISDNKLSVTYFGQQPSGAYSIIYYIPPDNTNNTPSDTYTADFGKLTTVCFVANTLILTTRGSVRVQDLRVGDLVLTAWGEPRSIKWLGHRHLECRRHQRPGETHPIRVVAHALDDNRPARDLYVSPGHGICVNVCGEVLIPAIALVNGSTIQQVEVDKVTYWHVELDSHDILLAENLPTESYLEMDNRAFFAESEAVALRARPDAPVGTHENFCRPFVDRGALLEAVRARLAARATNLAHERRNANAVA